jgi:hypothetical protein
MANSQLLWLGSIVSKKGGVLEALKHNKRELQSERGADSHIDVTRTPLNYALAGDDTPANIATHAKVQMVKAGIDTPRKNGVMAVEVLFSLPIDRHQQDTKPFFMDCYEWTLKTFAGELLSFDVHLDESAPHAHALILPLIDGKMQGSELKGDKANMYSLNDLFHKEIAHRYGLSRRDSKRLNSNDKATIERQVLTRLKADKVMQSCVWPCVKDLIHKDPLPFAQMLSIEHAPAKQIKVKHIVDICRSQGKGSFQR